MLIEPPPATEAEPAESPSRPQPANDDNAAGSTGPTRTRPPKRDLWTKLRNRRDWRFWALIIAGVLCILGIAATVGLEGWLVPRLWRWGLTGYELSFLNVLKAATGVVGAIFLALFSTFPLYTFGLFWQIVSLYFEDADDQFKEKLAATKQAQTDAEERLKGIEAQEDPTGLIPLVQYSRLQLEQYYTIAIRQTQQSFRYSVVAMWIGFIVMIGGILPFVLPLLNVVTTATPTSINVVIAAGGLVIELIAALFLWVYRSSIGQLTYFYNRQIYLHNVLLCYKIAATMKADQVDKALEVKALIVEKVLASSWTVERPESPNSKGLKDLMSVPKAVAASGG